VYEREKDMKAAYKETDGIKIKDRRVLVDVERGRTVSGWRPRRFGGGLGGRGYTKGPAARGPSGANGFGPPAGPGGFGGRGGGFQGGAGFGGRGGGARGGFAGDRGFGGGRGGGFGGGRGGGFGGGRGGIGYQSNGYGPPDGAPAGPRGPREGGFGGGRGGYGGDRGSGGGGRFDDRRGGGGGFGDRGSSGANNEPLGSRDRYRDGGRDGTAAVTTAHASVGTKATATTTRDKRGVTRLLRQLGQLRKGLSKVTSLSFASSSSSMRVR
jgi:U1 small nuclear ribonucleoprotein